VQVLVDDARDGDGVLPLAASLRNGRIAVAAHEAELAALEARVEALIAFTRELQDANDILRRELLALQERNRDLNGRVVQATTGLDALTAKVHK